MAESPGVAYLITSHTLPDQVLRLATVLRNGSSEATIAVHHDDRRCRLDHARLDRLGVRRIEPPSRVDWGDFSHLAVLVRCLRWLLDQSDFEWLVLLSGQDYPIRPVKEIEQSLAGAEVDAFIEAVPCPRPRLSEAFSEFALRYHYRWYPIPSQLVAPASAAARARRFLRVRRMPAGPLIGWPALRSPFGRGLLCHSGSDWFTLSRSAVEAIDVSLRERPGLLRYYRRTVLPTESCFQTLVANQRAVRRSGDHRRFLVFEPPDMLHPRVLKQADLDRMLASGLDFARKFDPTVDPGVLDEIDRRVHSG